MPCPPRRDAARTLPQRVPRSTPRPPREPQGLALVGDLVQPRPPQEPHGPFAVGDFPSASEARAGDGSSCVLGRAEDENAGNVGGR